MQVFLFDFHVSKLVLFQEFLMEESISYPIWRN